MNVDEFVEKVFEIAEEVGCSVELRLPGMSICFNKTSDKWLSEHHLRALFPAILDPDLSDRDINTQIEEVAPGRPCTHVKMRKILERLRARQLIAS
ncbi:hypothetical protein ACIPIN_14125 [Pseudomonas sp. NPDC087697]|uniref:hypothetical protein n=1 Tax=Pseudomonas sp. NPDC087697 TaxID=3364447 RepID=UPI00382733BD